MKSLRHCGSKGRSAITAIMLAGFDILRASRFRTDQIQDQHVIMDDKLEFRFAVFEVRQEGDRAIVRGRGHALWRTRANIAGVFHRDR